VDERWFVEGQHLSAQGRALSSRGRYVADCTRAYRDVPAGAYDPAEHRLHVAYCFGTQAAVVEVDEASGEVEVRHVIAAHDAGAVINPQAVEGQIEGGVMMGLGYALSEEFVMRQGQIVSDTLRKLGIPGIDRMPQISAIAVENPHPEGPLGAKGMGELPTSATAPAIVNAIYDAVGVRLHELPATAQRVKAAMEARGR
ncbi:MAG TPA: molybdopterin-dependent oxidoreductase, partial [Anaerolineae bacterium]|nr:molybdopterin-dependent oxidoreductase [Anaerolineae bacterium]